MARPPKNPAERQGHHKPAPVLTLSRGSGKVPPPPAGVLKKTEQRWRDYWKSEASSIVRPHHMLALERLFTLYDESERVVKAIRRRRMVKGSTGQPVQNPLLKYLDTCNKEIRALEDRFGLTPEASRRMGMASGGKSLDDLNRELMDDDDEDPRLAALR